MILSGWATNSSGSPIIEVRYVCMYVLHAAKDEASNTQRPATDDQRQRPAIDIDHGPAGRRAPLISEPRYDVCIGIIGTM